MQVEPCVDLRLEAFGNADCGVLLGDDGGACKPVAVAQRVAVVEPNLALRAIEPDLDHAFRRRLGTWLLSCRGEVGARGGPAGIIT